MENSGGWKTYRKFGEKTLPKNVFGPPTYDTFFPPLFWRLSVISLKRKRHRPDQPKFLRPPKVVLESTLCSTFSPPPNSRDTFCPPPQLLRKNFGEFYRARQTLLTFSLLISEDFCFFLDFPSDRSTFSTFVGGYENTAVAEKRKENPEILTN